MSYPGIAGKSVVVTGASRGIGLGHRDGIHRLGRLLYH